MTGTVVTARVGYRVTLRFPFTDLDAAVHFASWLVSRGYEVDMQDGNVLGVIRPSREVEECERLVRLFARSLASQPAA